MPLALIAGFRITSADYWALVCELAAIGFLQREYDKDQKQPERWIDWQKLLHLQLVRDPTNESACFPEWFDVLRDEQQSEPDVEGWQEFPMAAEFDAHGGYGPLTHFLLTHCLESKNTQVFRESIDNQDNQDDRRIFPFNDGVCEEGNLAVLGFLVQEQEVRGCDRPEPVAYKMLEDQRRRLPVLLKCLEMLITARSQLVRNVLQNEHCWPAELADLLWTFATSGTTHLLTRLPIWSEVSQSTFETVEDD